MELNVNNDTQSPNWKKVLYIGAAITGVALTAYVAYQAFSVYSAPSPSNQVGSFWNPTAQDASEQFIKTFENVKQCPSFEAFIQDQKENGYWGWSKSNMQRLFGAERDLSLVESRLDFYHGIQKKMFIIAKSHPEYKGTFTKEVAKSISALRDTIREYTRTRSWEGVHKWLIINEPRGKVFDFYWKKYGNATKVIQGTMRSNGAYDHPALLKVTDTFFSFAQMLPTLEGMTDLGKRGMTILKGLLKK